MKNWPVSTAPCSCILSLAADTVGCRAAFCSSLSRLNGWNTSWGAGCSWCCATLPGGPERSIVLQGLKPNRIQTFRVFASNSLSTIVRLRNCDYPWFELLVINRAQKFVLQKLSFARWQLAVVKLWACGTPTPLDQIKLMCWCITRLRNSWSIIG